LALVVVDVDVHGKTARLDLAAVDRADRVAGDEAADAGSISAGKSALLNINLAA
jgi:hypothetical protein